MKRSLFMVLILSIVLLGCSGSKSFMTPDGEDDRNQVIPIPEGEVIPGEEGVIPITESEPVPGSYLKIAIVRGPEIKECAQASRHMEILKEEEDVWNMCEFYSDCVPMKSAGVKNTWEIESSMASGNIAKCQTKMDVGFAKTRFEFTCSNNCGLDYEWFRKVTVDPSEVASGRIEKVTSSATASRSQVEEFLVTVEDAATGSTSYKIGIGGIEDNPNIEFVKEDEAQPATETDGQRFQFYGRHLLFDSANLRLYNRALSREDLIEIDDYVEDVKLFDDIYAYWNDKTVYVFPKDTDISRSRTNVRKVEIPDGKILDVSIVGNMAYILYQQPDKSVDFGRANLATRSPSFESLGFANERRGSTPRGER